MNSNQQLLEKAVEANRQLIEHLRQELRPHLESGFRARDGFALDSTSLSLTVLPGLEREARSGGGKDQRPLGEDRREYVALSVRISPRLMSAPVSSRELEADLALVADCLEELYTSDRITRLAICQRLGQLARRGAKPGLKRLAEEDADADVRAAAKQALSDADAPRFSRELLANQPLQLIVRHAGSDSKQESIKWEFTDHLGAATFKHVPADAKCFLKWVLDVRDIRAGHYFRSGESYQRVGGNAVLEVLPSQASDAGACRLTVCVTPASELGFEGVELWIEGSEELERRCERFNSDGEAQFADVPQGANCYLALVLRIEPEPLIDCQPPLMDLDSPPSIRVEASVALNAWCASSSDEPDVLGPLDRRIPRESLSADLQGLMVEFAVGEGGSLWLAAATADAQLADAVLEFSLGPATGVLILRAAGSGWGGACRIRAMRKSELDVLLQNHKLRITRKKP